MRFTSPIRKEKGAMPSLPKSLGRRRTFRLFSHSSPTVLYPSARWGKGKKRCRIWQFAEKSIELLHPVCSQDLITLSNSVGKKKKKKRESRHLRNGPIHGGTESYGEKNRRLEEKKDRHLILPAFSNFYSEAKVREGKGGKRELHLNLQGCFRDNFYTTTSNRPREKKGGKLSPY